MQLGRRQRGIGLAAVEMFGTYLFLIEAPRYQLPTASQVYNSLQELGFTVTVEGGRRPGKGIDELIETLG